WVVWHPAAAHNRRAPVSSRRDPWVCPDIVASVPERASLRRGLSAPRVLPLQLVSPSRPGLPARHTTAIDSHACRAYGGGPIAVVLTLRVRKGPATAGTWRGSPGPGLDLTRSVRTTVRAGHICPAPFRWASRWLN